MVCVFGGGVFQNTFFEEADVVFGVGAAEVGEAIKFWFGYRFIMQMVAVRVAEGV